MVDQLHNDDLSLDAQKHFVRSRAGLGHGHPRVEDKSLGYDLDCGVFARDGVFSNLDATWIEIGVYLVPRNTEKTRETYQSYPCQSCVLFSIAQSSLHLL